MRPAVVILCGGRGTRLQEHTRSIPKPMVEIGGRPILWHVLQIYLAQGFRRFLLLTGYLGEQVESFAASEPWPADAEIRCLATGEDTPTGGRLHRAAKALGDRPFCLTYGDGVADIDLAALLGAHAENAEQGAAATMTVVQPRLPFGVAHLNGDGVVRGFTEKPRSEQWINGGFFCFEPAVFDVLTPDSVLEREPLEQLAAAGGLRAFRHDGFWECMDTYKDAVALNDLWASGGAPWKRWA
ncbi:MAG TPA: sugar phosphate nucleotidyltransferase [Solirubrobacteraceae bacterium]|jgi:glucose-1-phosphate cytidylyltransferase|nr:sugar phosphate nucleotidyltransferase [Solirubrobacteraceae bacterium]